MGDWSSRANALFLTAREQTPGAPREKFLDDACGSDAALRRQIEAMLQADAQAGSFLESAAITATFSREGLEKPGERVGPYKLQQEIGVGGMGQVFMAEQTEPVRRTVALKIIKPGMDSRQVIARFEAERQALALMDHPNIAKVLDVGTTSAGSPYFVMELVKGLPITRYCDDRRLTLRERLQLFIPVCQAVQHAHQKGIIHRDLKPSNILVALYDGRPVPKVIDFGVAKATGQKLTERTMFTEFGAVLGTLEYMSPEQAELNQLDVDTRSDVYSLGVLLYELLTGSTPLERKRLKDAAFLEVLRVIREEEPPKPSTRLSSTDELPSIAANRSAEPKKLGGVMRGDLDWIVMKSLEKDRSRRYETANGLAREVERFLNDEPVEACPPSTFYRWRKFATKNRVALRTAAVIGIMLVSGICVSTWQAIRATRAEGQAKELLVSESKARALAQANEKKASQLAISERAAKDEQAKQRQVAESANERAMQALGSFTDELMQNLFASKKHFSESEKAVLRRALEQWNAFAESADTSTEGRRLRATGLVRVAAMQSQLGMATPAKANFQAAVEILNVLIKESSNDVTLHLMSCVANDQLAGLAFAEGYEAEAITRSRKVIDDLEQLHKSYPEEVQLQRSLARSLLNLFIGSEGRLTYEEREALVRRAMALYEALVARSDATLEDRLYLTSCYNDLGALAMEERDWEEGRRYELQALSGREQLVQEFPENWEILEYMSRPIGNLASLEYTLGNPDAGLEYERRQVEVLRQVVAVAPGVSSNRYAFGVKSHEYANDRLNAHRYDEALRVVDEAIDALAAPASDELFASHFQRIRQRLEATRAWALLRLDRAAEAMKLSDRLIEEPGWEDGDLYNFACLFSLASVEGGDQAKPYADRAIAALRKSIEAGYTEVEHMRVDGDLDAIRGHEGFDDALALATELAATRNMADHAGQSGKWDVAAERYQELIDRWPNVHQYWYYQAHILAIVGDHERYRRHCVEMIERFGQSTSPQTAERTAKAILLRPDVEIDLPLAAKLSEIAVAETAGDTYIRYYLFSGGLAAYRAGDFDKAAEFSRRSLQARGFQGYTDVFSNLLLAMASAKSGRDAEATAAWHAAQLKIAEFVPPLDSPDLSEGWVDVILINLLLRECRAALGENHAEEFDNVEFDRSNAYLLTGRYADAEREFRERLPVRTSVGDSWRTRSGLGECLLRQGKYEEAVAMFDGVWKERLRMIPDAAILLDAWDQSAVKIPENAQGGYDGLQFNGSSDYVVLPTVYFDGAPPWTLEVLVNPVEVDQAPGGWTSLISAADSGSISLGTNRRSWALDLHVADLEFAAWSENYRSAFAKQPPKLGVWQHVAGVWDGHEIRLYLDGQLQETVQGVDRCSRLSESPLMIGADPEDIFVLRVAQGFLHGRIRYARISRAVEYDADFTPAEQLQSTPQTLALFDFTIDTGRYAIDRSGHGNHGIIVGAKFVKAAD